MVLVFLFRVYGASKPCFRRNRFLGLAFVKIARDCLWSYFDAWNEASCAIRHPALGWPLAIRQEERLSYGIGSPLTLGGLKISLSLVCLVSSASVVSCRLVGESLLEASICEDSEGLLVEMFQCLE